MEQKVLNDSDNSRSATSFRIEKQLLKAFRVACVSHEVQQQDAIETAINLWLESVGQQGEGNAKENASNPQPALDVSRTIGGNNASRGKVLHETGGDPDRAEVNRQRALNRDAIARSERLARKVENNGATDRAREEKAPKAGGDKGGASGVAPRRRKSNAASTKKRQQGWKRTRLRISRSGKQDWTRYLEYYRSCS